MGIMDAFSKEDRVQLTVTQLISLIDSRAVAEAKLNLMLRMAQKGLPWGQIVNILTEDDKNE